MDEDISNFVAITAASPEAARGYLEMAGNNLEAAIQLFFESPDIQHSFAPADAPSSASRAPPVPASTRPSAGRQDDRGVIHIDSDDDGDTAMTVDDDDDDFEVAANAQAAAIARNAQEEEDAAMAKKLQEELYGAGGGGAGGAAAGGAGFDEVRSPIARTTETLVGGYEGDDGMDFETIMRAQMRQREAAARARGKLKFRSVPAYRGESFH